MYQIYIALEQVNYLGHTDSCNLKAQELLQTVVEGQRGSCKHYVAIVMNFCKPRLQSLLLCIARKLTQRRRLIVGLAATYANYAIKLC